MSILGLLTSYEDRKQGRARSTGACKLLEPVVLLAMGDDKIREAHEEANAELKTLNQKLNSASNMGDMELEAFNAVHKNMLRVHAHNKDLTEYYLNLSASARKYFLEEIVLNNDNGEKEGSDGRNTERREFSEKEESIFYDYVSALNLAAKGKDPLRIKDVINHNYWKQDYLIFLKNCIERKSSKLPAELEKRLSEIIGKRSAYDSYVECVNAIAEELHETSGIEADKISEKMIEYRELLNDEKRSYFCYGNGDSPLHQNACFHSVMNMAWDAHIHNVTSLNTNVPDFSKDMEQEDFFLLAGTFLFSYLKALFFNAPLSDSSVDGGGDVSENTSAILVHVVAYLDILLRGDDESSSVYWSLCDNFLCDIFRSSIIENGKSEELKGDNDSAEMSKEVENALLGLLCEQPKIGEEEEWQRFLEEREGFFKEAFFNNYPHLGIALLKKHYRLDMKGEDLLEKMSSYEGASISDMSMPRMIIDCSREISGSGWKGLTKNQLVEQEQGLRDEKACLIEEWDRRIFIAVQCLCLFKNLSLCR